MASPVSGDELIAAAESVWDVTTVFLSRDSVVVRLSGREVCAGCFACCCSRVKAPCCVCIETDINVPYEVITGSYVSEVRFSPMTRTAALARSRPPAMACSAHAH